MEKITLHNFYKLKERRINAISDAQSNCERLRTLVFYGVPSFVDRVPSFSSSVLVMPSGGAGIAIDTKYNNILSQENKDQVFIEKMINMIKNLSDIYKEVFVDIFINCSKKSSYYSNDKKEYLKRKDIYKILERGYLKLAILDHEIDYTIYDECQFSILIQNQQQKQKKMKKEMKLQLKELQSFIFLNNIRITDAYTGAIFSIGDEISFERNCTFLLANINLSDTTFKRIHSLISWINELYWDDQKKTVLKFLFLKDWKYLDTTDRNNLSKGLLALALLSPEIDYTFSEFENDLLKMGNSKKYIEIFKNYQFGLKL